MGLIQRVIEAAGIATIGISIVREYAEQVQPPRTAFLKWPFGHPVGEPHNRAQQRAVVEESLRLLYEMDTPGTIVDLPFAWRRHDYSAWDQPAL